MLTSVWVTRRSLSLNEVALLRILLFVCYVVKYSSWYFNELNITKVGLWILCLLHFLVWVGQIAIVPEQYSDALSNVI